MALTAKQRLEALIAARKALRETEQLSPTEAVEVQETFQLTALAEATKFQWHPDQLRAIELALADNHVAITGPAGSGKTTLEVEIAARLSQKLSPIEKTDGHKYLTRGTPGMVFISFTNKAVENTRRKLPLNLRHNAMTIHKLLEFQPVFTQEWDPVTCKYKTKREFVPGRNAANPLPSDIQVICMDEATMTGIPLWNQLIEALPNLRHVRFIFFGDIQQLPPVFGKSIFVHAFQAGINNVELTHVHRQALESPILALAHRILSGKVIPAPELEAWNQNSPSGSLTIKPWKKSLTPEKALEALGIFLPQFIDAGQYEPMQDVILTPFNKAFGTIEINNIVATHLTKKGTEPVYEILGGMQKKYFRVGDKVLWNKTEHIITAIEPNPAYAGPDPHVPSTTLDYWGIEHDAKKVGALASFLLDDDAANQASAEHAAAVDGFLNQLSKKLGDDSDNTGGRAISHCITIEPQDWDTEEYGPVPETTLSSAGELGVLDLAYAITVHKSQGSEYNRVLFITHKSQGNMLFRELLYTAVTRAKKELLVIGEPSLFVQGITSQRLPGKTLADKIASFDRYMEINGGKGGENVVPKGLWMFAPDKTDKTEE